MIDNRPVRPTDGRIDFVEYRPDWPEEFEVECRMLEQHLGHAFVRIEHLGSTAVPGMPSKPIIDIAGAVRSIDDVLGELDSLYALGYDNRGFFADADDHLFFRKVVAGKRTHHLHVVTIDSAQLASWLAFRDYLRTHATAADDYAAAKREIFARFPGDRTGYVEAKSVVVDALITRMRNSTS